MKSTYNIMYMYKDEILSIFNEFYNEKFTKQDIIKKCGDAVAYRMKKFSYNNIIVQVGRTDKKHHGVYVYQLSGIALLKCKDWIKVTN